MYKSEFDKYVEPKLKQLEIITSRLARRSKKTSVALITPFPISNAVFGEEVKGTVLAYLFPCKGKITKGTICLKQKPKQDIFVHISLMGEEKGNSKTILLNKRNNPFTLNIEVSEFDKLKVTLQYNEDEKEFLTEIWTCLLWVPTVKDVEAKSFLIDALEKEVKEFMQLEDPNNA